jgi:pimeloyl-ACP methyl ester carboxylesterase
VEYFAEGRGPLIVLLPSAYRGAEDFADLATRLARNGLRVVRPQPRGVGASTGPTEGVSLYDFADDIAAVIEKEGGEPAVIAGHAYGNWIARATATRYPSKVRALVLLAAAAKGAPPPDLIEAIATSADPDRSRTERLAALRYAFFAPGNDPLEYLTGWHPQIRHLQRQAAAATAQGEWWDAGGKPILEIQAERDPFLPPENRDALRQELGERVTVVRISNASHALVPEQPQAVAQAIIDYVRTLPP